MPVPSRPLSKFCDAARHAQPTGHAHSLSRYRSDKEVRTCSGLIRPAGGKWKSGSDPTCLWDTGSLFIVPTDLGIWAWDRCSAGRNIGCAEAMARGEVFFVTFVFPFVSAIG